MNKMQKQRILDSLDLELKNRQYVRVVESAKDYLKKEDVQNDSSMITSLYRLIANSYFYLAQYDNARESYWHIYNIALANNDDTKLALAYLGIGGCHFHQNKTKQAEKYFLKAKEQYEKDSENSDLSNVYNWLGIVYNKQEKLYLALEMNQKAMEFAEKKQNYATMETSCISVALTFFYIGDSERALEYFKKAESINNHTKNIAAKADIYNNLGMFYRRQKDYWEAVKYYKKAIELRLQYFDEDYLRLGYSYGNLAAAEIDFGDYKSAKKDLDKALESYSKLEYNPNLVQTIIAQLGLIAVKENDVQAVKAELDKYETIQSEYNTSEEIELYLYVKYMYSELIGDFKNAHEYHKQFSEIRYKQATKYHEKVIEDMEMRLNYEKKKAEAEIYQLKNTELAEAIKTRDKLFSAIAHDLRGPISSIVEVMSLVLQDDSFEYNDMERLLHELRANAVSSYNLVQNLLSWARTQMAVLSPVVAEIDLDKITEDCLSQLDYLLQKKDIKIEKKVLKESSSFGDKDMISFIVRNLLNNAIKFTDVGGQIIIDITCTSTFTSFKITDNGVGMTEEKQKRLFTFFTDNSTPGTNNEMGTGLGLILCKDFAKLLDSDLTVESELGKGSTFNLKLPIQNLNRLKA